MKKIALFFICISLFACSKEKENIKEVVIRYNDVMIEGYKSLNMTPLAQVATKDQATKVYFHMAALGEGKVKMIATQKNIEFKNIKVISSSEAEVKTREAWHYVHEDIESGKAVEDKSVSYNLTYKLIKEYEKWVVSDITIDGKEESTSS